MVDLQVITPATKPREWFSTLSYPQKPNESLCICLDSCDLNKAIIWEHYVAPTLDEITHKLSSATGFFFKIRCKGWLLEHTPGHPLLILNHI